MRLASAASGSDLGALGDPLGRPSDRLDRPVVHVADLDTVVEQHPVSLPVEPVGEEDASFGALGNVLHLGDRSDLVADLQIDLALVGRRERVWLPEVHAHSVPDPTPIVHVPIEHVSIGHVSDGTTGQAASDPADRVLAL